MRIATISFEIKRIESFADFQIHLESVMTQALSQGTELIVLPELLTLELLHLAPDIRESQIPKFLGQYEAKYLEILTKFASEHSVGIVGGSTITSQKTNVCPVISPCGNVSLHEKNVLTQWEAVEWNLVPGKGNPETYLPDVGVLVCYDSEFPEATRMLTEKGVRLLCVPSYTESQRGHQRVRWSCLARAIENQIFVAHSALVGSLGREPVAQTYGSSAVLSPSIEPFIVTAVLAETELNQEGVAHCDLDFEALERGRNSGDVRNWNDRNKGRWHL